MKSLPKEIVVHYIVPHLTPKETLALSQVDKHTLSLFPIQMRKQLVRTIRCTMFESCFDDVVSNEYATILIAISNAIYDGIHTVVLHPVPAQTLFLYEIMRIFQCLCPLYNTIVLITAKNGLITTAKIIEKQRIVPIKNISAHIISTLDELHMIPHIDCVFIDESVYIDPRLVQAIEKKQGIKLLVKL